MANPVKSVCLALGLCVCIGSADSACSNVVHDDGINYGGTNGEGGPEGGYPAGEGGPEGGYPAGEGGPEGGYTHGEGGPEGGFGGYLAEGGPEGGFGFGGTNRFGAS
jgi:hypothetical protein